MTLNALILPCNSRNGLHKHGYNSAMNWCGVLQGKDYLRFSHPSVLFIFRNQWGDVKWNIRTCVLAHNSIVIGNISIRLENALRKKSILLLISNRCYYLNLNIGSIRIPLRVVLLWFPDVLSKDATCLYIQKAEWEPDSLETYYRSLRIGASFSFLMQHLIPESNIL
jgi:hypothetical protein